MEAGNANGGLGYCVPSMLVLVPGSLDHSGWIAGGQPICSAVLHGFALLAQISSPLLHGSVVYDAYRWQPLLQRKQPEGVLDSFLQRILITKAHLNTSSTGIPFASCMKEGYIMMMANAQNIHDKVTELEFEEAATEIWGVESQYSIEGGVIVQVVGSLHSKVQLAVNA